MNTDGFLKMVLPDGKDSHTIRVLDPAGRYYKNEFKDFDANEVGEGVVVKEEVNSQR